MFKNFTLFSIVHPRLFELAMDFLRFIATKFERIFMPYFNWRWRPTLPYRKPAGSRLEMVVFPNEKWFVYWPWAKSLFSPFGLFGKGANVITTIVLLALFVYLMTIVAPTISGTLFSLLDIKLPTLNEPFTNTLAGLIVILGVLYFFWMVGSYWYFEWWRRHKVLFDFTEDNKHREAVPVLSALFPLIASGDNVVVRSDTPATEMLETQASTDIELLGGLVTSKAQDKWSRYLSRKYQTRAIKIPSRSGAPDLFPPIEDGETTLDTLKVIAKRGETFLRIQADYKEKELKVLSQDSESPNWDRAKAELEAKRIRERFFHFYAYEEQWIPNLYDLVDPGIWNRKTGLEFTEGTITIISPPLPSSPGSNPNPGISNHPSEEMDPSDRQVEVNSHLSGDQAKKSHSS